MTATRQPAADADGTRSILDIAPISAEADFCTSCALSDEELTRFFGTTTPTVDQMKDCDRFWDSLPRGQARHIIVRDPDGPALIFFAGYSYD